MGKGELAGGAGRLCKQAEQEGPAPGEASKLGHIADALGKGDDGGPGGQASPLACRWPQGPPRRCRRRGRPWGIPASAEATRSTP